MIYFLIPPTFSKEYSISRRSNCVVKAKGDYVYPPIELATLVEYIRENGFKVDLIDGNIIAIDKIFERIKNPSYFVVNTGIFSFENDAKFLQILKKSYPKSKIITYGQAATALPKEILNFSDFVVIGEPEKTVLEILNGKLKKGVCYKKNKKIYLNNEANFIENLNELPIPARDLLDNKKYRHAFLRPFTEIFTSRGCPYRCTFCTSKNYFLRYRSRNAESVIKELKEVYYKYGIKNFSFADDTFTIDRKKVIEICDWIIKEKIKFNWIALSRVDTVDEEMLGHMKKAGCNVILYGIESGSQEVLNKLKKDTTIEQIKKTINITKKIGIEAHGYFVIGSPFDTKKSIKENIKFAKSLKLDYASFNVFIPYPNTDAYSELEKQNKLLSKDWLDYDQTTGRLVFKHDNLEDKEITNLIKEAYKSFYFSPGYLARKLKSRIAEPGKIKGDFANAKKLLKIVK